MTLGSVSKSNPGAFRLVYKILSLLRMPCCDDDDDDNDDIKQHSLKKSAFDLPLRLTPVSCLGRMSRDSKVGGGGSARSFGSVSLLDSSGHR